MTSFVERDASHLGVDKFATSTTATALYENLFSVLEKDATAVAAGAVLSNNYIVTAMIAALQVTEAKLAASSVAQGKLKTTTGEVSHTDAGSSQANVTLPGGQYGFWPQVKHAVGTSIAAQVAVALSNTSYVTNISLTANGGGGAQAYAQQRYVQASPPYDLGDGEVPLFVFLRLNAAGKIVGTYIAQDPPWANNGPTDIRPDGADEKGRPYVLRRHLTSALRQRLASTDPNERAEALMEARHASVEPVPLTPAMKNADMGMVPHPFIFNALVGHSVVMLDPVSPLCVRLAALHEAGESVAGLLHGGYLSIGNEPLNRCCAPGVMPVAVQWKRN